MAFLYTPAIDHDKHQKLRKQLWQILHHGRGPSGHAFNFILILLILTSLSILPLEILPTFKAYHGALATVEIITTSLFTVEYGLRLYAAPNRLKYIFSFFGIVDLLSILPFYLGALGTQYIRVLRFVRLLKIGEMEAAAAEEEDGVMEEVVGLANGERIEYIVTRHAVFLLVGTIPTLLAITFGLFLLMAFPLNPVTISLAVTMFIFGIIFLWKAWLDFSYDVIYITSRRLIFQNQHLLGRSINQVNYHAITNVKPDFQSVFSYLLGYGSLVIETPAAEVGQIVLNTVRNHEKAAHLIMHKCFESQESDVEKAARHVSKSLGHKDHHGH